jgi:uncharacterized protein (UPF0548 family)
MKISLHLPSSDQVAPFLSKMSQEEHSYKEIGRTRTTFPEGYDHDDHKVLLGKGHEDFQKARQLLNRWEMFPQSWTKIYPEMSPIEEGQVVAVLFRLFGFWWYNACRIVYTINDDRHYGFAYGTLKGHVEKGEEIFQVYMDEQARVWFQIKAFSRPNTWYTRLSYPLPRMFQKRFVRDAFRQMKNSL